MISCGRLPPRVVGVIGVGSLALSAIIASIIGINFMLTPPTGNSFTIILWHWMTIGSFGPAAAVYLDPLSLVMMLVVTVVGFLIHALFV